MQFLDLSNNQLTGSIDLTRLPKHMRYLYIKDNAFTGSFVATSLPRGLHKLLARGNSFDAIAVADSQTKAELDLRGSGAKSVIDKNRNEETDNVVL